MAETPCGSVHESPVRHLPHAPKRKARKTKFRDWASARQRFEPNLELPPLRIPAMCYRPERMTDKTIRRSGAISMLMTSERRPAIRTMRGWAIDVLQKAGAIRECEEHGWMQDAPIRMHGSGPSISPVETRQQASPLMQRRPRFTTC